MGDLQWPILGIITVNAFISVWNPNVLKCGLCGFHCVMHCGRLRPLFVLFSDYSPILMKCLFLVLDIVIDRYR